MALISDFSRLSAILSLDITNFLRNSEIASTKLGRLQAQFRQAGQSLVRGPGLAFGLIGVGAVQAAEGFDRLSFQLQALAGETATAALTKNAKELGLSSAFTATEIQKLQLELGKLGLSATDIQSVAQSVTDISTIFDTDLAQTGAGFAATIKQFTLDFDSAAQVSDIFATAVGKTQLTVPELQEALKNVGPVAAQLGFSLEETVAVLGTFADAGLKGGIAGTKFKSALNSLVKKFPDAKAKFLDLVTGQASYNEILDSTNSRGGIGIQIIQDNITEYQNLVGALNLAEGATERLTDGMQDRLFFSLERVKNSFQALGIAIGEGFGPFLTRLADRLGFLVKSLTDGGTATSRWIAELMVITVESSLIIFAISQIGGAITGLIANPAFAAAAAVASIAAAFFKAKIDADIFAANMEEANSSFEDLVGYADSLSKGNEVILTTVQDYAALQRDAEASIRAQETAIAALIEKEKKLNLEREQAGARFDETSSIEVARLDKEIADNQAKQSEFTQRIFALQPLIKESKFQISKIEAEQLKALRERYKIELDNLGAGDEDLKLAREKHREYQKQLKALNEVNKALQKQTIKSDAGAFGIDGQEQTQKIVDLYGELTVLGVTIDEANQSLAELMSSKELLVPEGGGYVFIPPEGLDEFERLGNLASLAQGFTDGFGRAMSAAITGTQKFGEALKNNLIQALQAVISKVISLIALYGILAIVSGGTSVGLGAFVSSGFGLGSQSMSEIFSTGFAQGVGPAFRSGSAGGGTGSAGFRLQGQDLVLSAERSGRAFSRIG